MAEELDIPMPRMAPAEPSYRRSRVGEPVDATTKRLALIGGALALVLLGVVGLYALGGRHAGGGVPVVQADARPLRVKPENRGGMQLTGQDDAILSGDAAGKDALAPPPEQPAPDGLAAQTRQEAARREAAAAPPSAPSPPPTPPSTPTPVAVATPAPTPAVPAPRVATAKPAVPAVGAATARASQPGGAAQVQLAALDSEQAALAEWQRLEHRMPSLLSGRQPNVQRSDRAGKTYWRLRTGGFADVAQANTFCAQIRAQGGGCSLATFWATAPRHMSA